MPKYELMYILSSAVSDDAVPGIATEIDQFIQAHNGQIQNQQFLGKKKLAYPIKRTRNGFYVLQTFNLEGTQLATLDNKLRSMEGIIRYLVVNLDEQERRRAKTEIMQEKIRAHRRPQKPQEETAEPAVQLTESELEKKIEKALESEDLAK